MKKSNEERLKANAESARRCRRNRNAKRDAEQAELGELRVENAKLRERIAQLEKTEAGATMKRLECENIDLKNKLEKSKRETAIVKQQLALSNSERDSATKELEEFLILGQSLFNN